jgi:hypothetical protein
MVREVGNARIIAPNQFHLEDLDLPQSIPARKSSTGLARGQWRASGPDSPTDERADAGRGRRRRRRSRRSRREKTQ